MNKSKIIKQHPCFNFAEDLNDICTPLKSLNIDYFSHVQIDDKNRFSALGMEPEFAKLYLEKDYYRFDIHMAQLEQKESFIIWDNVVREKESKMLSDDFTHFNLGHTFTICLKQKNYTDYFHFAAILGQDFMNQQYLLNLDRLYQFIYYFRDKVSSHRELKRAYDIKLSIPDHSAHFVDSNTNLIPSEGYSDEVLGKRIYLDQDTYLTAKEFECLGFLAAGKKIHEVAELMAITPRTAKAHIENIRYKLNCKNLFQLGLKYASIKL